MSAVWIGEYVAEWLSWVESSRSVGGAMEQRGNEVLRIAIRGWDQNTLGIADQAERDGMPLGLLDPDVRWEIIRRRSKRECEANEPAFRANTPSEAAENARRWREREEAAERRIFNAAVWQQFKLDTGQLPLVDFGLNSVLNQNQAIQQRKAAEEWERLSRTDQLISTVLEELVWFVATAGAGEVFGLLVSRTGQGIRIARGPKVVEFSETDLAALRLWEGEGGALRTGPQVPNAPRAPKFGEKPFATAQEQVEGVRQLEGGLKPNLKDRPLLPPDHVLTDFQKQALRENVRGVINNTVDSIRKGQTRAGTNPLATQMSNPRFRFLDQVPDAKQAFLEAIKDLDPAIQKGALDALKAQGVKIP
jgi:hypothetical protein